MTRWKFRWDWAQSRWLFVWMVGPVMEPVYCDIGFYTFDPDKNDK